MDEVLIADALVKSLQDMQRTSSLELNIDFYSHPLTRLNIDEDNILITPHIGGCCTSLWK